MVKKKLRERKLGWKKLAMYQKVGVILLVVVISGFVGWVWEFLIQEIPVGFRELYVKGGNLLPWINIYAYGALLILLTSYRLRKRPLMVFLVSALVCGALEYFAGWIVYTVGHGTRYWNYSDAWWAIGNINGFVCPASVLAFGLGALALVYLLMPFCVKLATRMSKRGFLILTVGLFSLVITDDITNLVLKNMDLPTAMNLYEHLGWKLKVK